MMAGRGKRSRETPEQAAESVRRSIELGDEIGVPVNRIAWAVRYEQAARMSRDLAEAELACREFETGRGAKWSYTYRARRAIEDAERYEAMAAAYRE